MSDLTPSRDEPRADREPVAARHLDELEEITREYARLTERDLGAWTLLVVGVWIIGAESLLQASPHWGRLAFLALVPATLAVYMLEKRLARPYGAVAYAAKDGRERRLSRQLKVVGVWFALVNEFLALLLLYQAVHGVAWGDVPAAWMVVAAFVFPAVAAVPAATPFLTGWRFEVSGLLSGPMMLGTIVVVPFSPDPTTAWLRHIILLGAGGLMALLAPFLIWVHRAQLHHLDQRMALLRGRLR